MLCEACDVVEEREMSKRTGGRQKGRINVEQDGGSAQQTRDELLSALCTEVQHSFFANLSTALHSLSVRLKKDRGSSRPSRRPRP